MVGDTMQYSECNANTTDTKKINIIPKNSILYDFTAAVKAVAEGTSKYIVLLTFHKSNV